jgi:hypothetical protein
LPGKWDLPSTKKSGRVRVATLVVPVRRCCPLDAAVVRLVIKASAVVAAYAGLRARHVGINEL